MDILMPTTVVGSLPQPNWLVNREVMLSRHPPRVRLNNTIWRVSEPYLEEAQDDATYQAVREQRRWARHRVGRGDPARELSTARFATTARRVDIDNPAEVEAATRRARLPRVVGEIRRVRPVQVRDVAHLRAITDKPIKITVPARSP